MKIWNFRPVRKQVGVGFVEILITVVVVSAGLLSLARMQGGFLSSGGEMKARSEAVIATTLIFQTHLKPKAWQAV